MTDHRIQLYSYSSALCDLRTSRHSDIRNFGHPDIRAFGHPGIWTCIPLDLRTFVPPNPRTSGHLALRTSGPSDIRTFGHTDPRTSVLRTSGPSDIWLGTYWCMCSSVHGLVIKNKGPGGMNFDQKSTVVHSKGARFSNLTLQSVWLVWAQERASEPRAVFTQTKKLGKKHETRYLRQPHLYKTLQFFP